MRISERLRQEELILTEMQTTLTAYDSVLGTDVSRINPRRRVAYASSAITTGKRMYDVFEEYGVTSLEAIKQKDPKIIFERIMQPNIQDGHAFGQELRKKYGTVIVPGDFFAKGWAQQHYMSLWEQVIQRYADDIQFNKDWSESTGCAQEFLIGLQHNKTLRERGQKGVLTKQAGAEKIRASIDRIDRLGADPAPLYDTYRRITLHNPKTIFVASANQ